MTLVLPVGLAIAGEEAYPISISLRPDYCILESTTTEQSGNFHWFICSAW